MTYYSKYLKYKNKYLELKNMIGGDYRGSEAVLNGLWQERGRKGKVFTVTRDELISNYSHYCWINGRNHGLGFFLYSLRQDQEPVTGHNRVGKYAVWNMTLNNIGLLNKVNSISDTLSYKTTIDLPTTDGNKLDKETSFDWSNNDGGWVYKSNNNKLYKSTLIPIDFGALWKARNDAGKVFTVTRPEFVNNYSHYCWISGPSYGLGFFLYRLKSGQEPVTRHNKVGDYVVWDIKKYNIGPLKKVTSISDTLSYKTTIVLDTEDGNKLDKETSFDWSNNDGGWVYNDVKLGSYKAELTNLFI